jgi:hypothetical protein
VAKRNYSSMDKPSPRWLLRDRLLEMDEARNARPRSPQHASEMVKERDAQLARAAAKVALERTKGMSVATNAAHHSLNPTTWAAPWPRIGDSVPRPRSSRASATRATNRGGRPGPKPSAKPPASQLVGKAPLGSLPAKRGRSAASSLPEFVPFALCQLVENPPQGPELQPCLSRTRQGGSRFRQLHHRW